MTTLDLRCGRAALAAWALVASFVFSQSPTHVLDGAANGEAFGRSVAALGDVDGDGRPDLLIGTDANRAEVRSGADGSLVRVVTGAAPGDDLGHAVARVGDVDLDGRDDFVVGAPQITAGGAGYVRLVSGATGAALQVWSGPGPGDRFGAAVAGIGDVDGDGLRDVLVGAPNTAAPGVNAGRIYVFGSVTGALVHQLGAGSAHDNFGFSVADAGDVDGDGFGDFAVGAPGANQVLGSLFLGTGAVSLFSGQTLGAIRVLLGDDVGDQFGWSVDGAGDVDADGRAEVVVGAPGDDDGALNAGAATVHGGATGGVIARFDGAAANDRLGTAVAGAGDVDGDFLPDVLLGAPFAGAFGEATVASPATLLTVFTVAGRSVFSSFGAAVAGGIDVDGDGRREVAVAAPGAPAPGAATGRVTVLSHRPVLGPAAAGTVTAGGGVLTDVLLLQGSSGGAARRVEAAIGAPISLAVLQPPANPAPAPFAIFGLLRAAAFTDAVPIPTGDLMAFVPCPMLPSGAPMVFTLTTSFGADPCGTVTPSTPSPWGIVDGDGFPHPLEVTLQGVIESAPGVLGVTNAVVLVVG